MTAKTNAERQADLKARRIAAGLKELRNLWCYPEDEERIRAYVLRLNKASAKKSVAR